MTGPEHYKHAEALLEELMRLIEEAPPPETDEQVQTNAALSASAIGLAQVHATLALAAATVDAAYGEMSGAADRTWGEVACA